MYRPPYDIVNILTLTDKKNGCRQYKQQKKQKLSQESRHG